MRRIVNWFRSLFRKGGERREGRPVPVRVHRSPAPKRARGGLRLRSIVELGR